MKSNWQHCKSILCIRPDNMGDLIMTGPALRALKETFDCKITVLTSSMAAMVSELMPEVDEVIIFDVPWVKSNTEADKDCFDKAIEEIKRLQFDAAVIFTVYSQNPLPTAMLAYLADIPLRLSYCRENPYQLLTNWFPDEEPYTCIKHQVRRDLDLVASVGATTINTQLKLYINDDISVPVKYKIQQQGVDINKPWLIFHPGVSEKKREYPKENWAAAARKLSREYQIVLTGAAGEKELCEEIKDLSGVECLVLAGQFSLHEFAALIKLAPLVVSVNTGTVHIAAAVGTPVVVLYALTNPQHTPWQVPCRVLPYQVSTELQSQNEVIRHVNRFFYNEPVPMPDYRSIVCAINDLLNGEVSSANEAILQPYQTPAENRAE